MRFIFMTAAIGFVVSQPVQADSSDLADPANVFQPTVLTQPAVGDFRFEDTYSLIDVADINGDGYPDTLQHITPGRGCLRFCVEPPGTVTWSENTRTKAVFGLEDVRAETVEEFNAIRFRTQAFDTDGTFRSAELADVDGDGDLDLVAELFRYVHPEVIGQFPPDDRLSVFYNTGADPVFAEETRLLGVDGLHDVEHLNSMDS